MVGGLKALIYVAFHFELECNNKINVIKKAAIAALYLFLFIPSIIQLRKHKNNT